VQLEVLSELLRLKKVEAAAKHLDTTAAMCARGWPTPGNRSGAALTDSGETPCR